MYAPACVPDNKTVLLKKERQGTTPASHPNGALTPVSLYHLFLYQRENKCWFSYKVFSVLFSRTDNVALFVFPVSSENSLREQS